MINHTERLVRHVRVCDRCIVASDSDDMCPNGMVRRMNAEAEGPVQLAKVTDSDDFGTDPARNWTVNDRLRARKIGSSSWMLRTNDLDSLADWFTLQLSR